MPLVVLEKGFVQFAQSVYSVRLRLFLSKNFFKKGIAPTSSRFTEPIKKLSGRYSAPETESRNRVEKFDVRSGIRVSRIKPSEKDRTAGRIGRNTSPTPSRFFVPNESAIRSTDAATA